MGLNVDEGGEGLNLVLSRDLINVVSVYLKEGDFVLTVLFGEVSHNLVPLFLEHVAPVAALHVEVDEDVLVCQLRVLARDQVFELFI